MEQSDGVGEDRGPRVENWWHTDYLCVGTQNRLGPQRSCSDRCIVRDTFPVNMASIDEDCTETRSHLSKITDFVNVQRTRRSTP